MAKPKGMIPARPTKEQLEDWLGEKGANTEVGFYPGPSDAEPRKFDYDAIGELVAVHRYGIPHLLRREDIQAYFHLSKRSAQRFIKRYLVPMGCVVQVGRRYLIQPWGVYRLLHPNGRCAYCGEGGKGYCEPILKFSVMAEDDTSDGKHFKKHKYEKPPIEEL